MESVGNYPKVPGHQLEGRLVITAHHAGYVDASVLVEWFLNQQESDRDRALALRDLYVSGRTMLYAPWLALLEVLNVFRFSPKANEEVGQTS